MSERETQRRSDRPVEDEVDDVPASTAQEAKEALDDDVDAILDEIDEVLEENAAEFIASFVQKGGQ